MRRSHLLATVAVATVAATPPAQAAPLLVLGLIAAGAAGIAAANQEPGEEEDWEYTDKYGWVGGAPEEVSRINAPLAPKPGTSPRLVSACRDAVAKKAQPYGVASVEAVSAGKEMRVKGRIIAPIEVRAIYKVRGGHEVKRSTVRCELDRAGRVIATS